MGIGRRSIRANRNPSVAKGPQTASGIVSVPTVYSLEPWMSDYVGGPHGRKENAFRASELPHTSMMYHAAYLIVIVTASTLVDLGKVLKSHIAQHSCCRGVCPPLHSPVRAILAIEVRLERIFSNLDRFESAQVNIPPGLLAQSRLFVLNRLEFTVGDLDQTCES